MTSIGIVSPNPDTASGGVERFCQDLSNALGTAGYNARVVGFTELRDCDFDLVITNGMLRTVRRSPRIHVYHGCWVDHMRYDHPDASRRWRFTRTVAGATQEALNGLQAMRVAVSRNAADGVARHYRLTVDKVISNGVDTNIFTPTSRGYARQTLGIDVHAKVALFTGRDEHRKRPDIAISSAQANGYEVFSAGPGTIPGMTALGLLDRRQMALAASAADVMLAPSGYEACSLSILEVLAVGTPVVATRTGWIPDLLREVPGYAQLTSEVGDIAGMRSALAAVDQSRTAVKEASDFVRQQLNLTAFAARWGSAVQLALAGNPRGK